MTEKKFYLTKDGLGRLQAELDYLRTVRRAEVAEQIQQAKELGIPGDDNDYEDAKNAQGFVEGRILELEHEITNAVIIEDGGASDRVRLGSTVTVSDPEGVEEHYTIVGSIEANPAEGKISNESPVGQALIGRKAGEAVQVLVPAGALKLKIVSIE